MSTSSKAAPEIMPIIKQNEVVVELFDSVPGMHMDTLGTVVSDRMDS